MPQITLVEAVTQALAYEMAQDENVVVFGEDVGINGGVFRATDGLYAKFGADRVLDTPVRDQPDQGDQRVQRHRDPRADKRQQYRREIK